MNKPFSGFSASHRPEPGAKPNTVAIANAMPEERLPFTVRVVQTENELLKAVQIRHAAYARHVPSFAESLRSPESADFESDVVVLLAESKLDGSPMGTARIQTNRVRPLGMEQSVMLPEWMRGQTLAEVTRLGIEEGRIGRIVKLALIKACFQYCEQKNISFALVAGRSPIDRQYEQLLFEDVFPGEGFIPMQHANNLPHRVMAFEIATGHARWTAAAHPLLKFFSHTRHPDIDLLQRVAPKTSLSLPAAPASTPNAVKNEKSLFNLHR